MIPPLVSFVAWNRLGLTARNLVSLFKTKDDFELYIVDNGSQDNTWEYIMSLKDERIKSRTRFDVNRGQVYAVNYNLAKRRENQYFITVDSDVNIHTDRWISRFMKAFEEFPEVGLLGAVTPQYYNRYRHPLVKRDGNGIFYLQMQKGFVEGCCQCLRPELIKLLGYWSEENCMGDVEICQRICKYTSFKAGFLPAIEIDQVQMIECRDCCAKNCCSFDKGGKTCFEIWKEKYRNPEFRFTYGWKYQQCIKEIEEGKRDVFCASIHDKDSMKKHFYNKLMAEENFRYYYV